MVDFHLPSICHRSQSREKVPAHCRVSGRHEPQTQCSCFNARSALLCLPPTLCSRCGVLSPQHLAECTLTIGANIRGAMRVAKPQCGVGENHRQGGMAGQRRRGPGGLGLLQTARRWPSTETSDLKHKLSVYQAWREKVEHTGVSDSKARGKGNGEGICGECWALAWGCGGRWVA